MGASTTAPTSNTATAHTGLRWTQQETHTSPATPDLSDYPTTPGVLQTANNEIGAGYFTGIVTEFNATGTALTYSTYLGGSGGREIGRGIALDPSGDAYVFGSTTAANFPVTDNAYQPGNGDAAKGNSSAFLAELNPAGSALVYSTYLGGSGGDEGNAVALDSGSNAYLTGTTASTDFPVTVPAYQSANTSSGGTAFVARLGIGTALIPTTPTATTLTVTAAGGAVTTVPSGTAVTLTATVTAATAPVSPGLVTFCDATATLCENSAILGTAQLTAAGTATLKFVPGIGSHSYKAVFAGTNLYIGSTSAAEPLAVTGLYPTTTTLSATGAPGSYTLTSTVVGQGVLTLTPGGSVSFVDQTNGNAVLGTAPLTAGTAAQTLVAAPTSPLTTGTQPYAVATGDFNGDGFTDFAVENYGSGSVSVFLGNGDGTFKPQVTYAVGTLPEGIAAVRRERRWEARLTSHQHR